MATAGSMLVTSCIMLSARQLASRRGSSPDAGSPSITFKRNERGLSVPRDTDPDCLNGFLAQSGHFEGNLFRHFVFHRIDDAHSSADLGRNPDLGPVALEFGETRTCIDEHVRHDLARLGV